MRVSTKLLSIVTGTCIDCRTHLPLSRRLLRHVRCPECEEKHDRAVAADLERKKAQHDAGLNAYSATLGQLRLGVDLRVVLPRIAATASVVALSDAEIKALNERAFASYLGEATADDVITREEDTMLGAVGQGLGIRMTADQWARYQVAAANAGLLPVVSQSQIMLDGDEASHVEIPVRLLTKRVITERRTNFNSMSFPLGQSGVRYRVGQARSRTVVVGTRTEVEDTGLLAVTSKRIVFAGREKTLEFRHGRLVGLRLFSDGLGLQIANRQSIPTFQTNAREVDVLAALINAAVGQSRGTFRPAQAAPVRPIAVGPAPELPDPGHDAPNHSSTLRPEATVGMPDASLSAEANDAGSTRSAGEPAAATEVEVRVDRDDVGSQRILQELAKIPGVEKEVSTLSSQYQLGVGTTSSLAAALERAIDAYRSLDLQPPDGPLPPSITPQLPSDIPAAEPPARFREVNQTFETTLAHLRDIGLSERNAEDLREDFRRGLMNEAQLRGVEILLMARSGSQPSPARTEPAERQQPDAPTPSVDDEQRQTDAVAYYLLNTNYSNDPADDDYMLANRKAAAFFDPWKHKIEWLTQNDYVFLYRNGAGIVAFGQATGSLETRAYHSDPNAEGEEYAMGLDPFYVLRQPMSAASIKEVAARNVSFRQTMITLDTATGAKIRSALLGEVGAPPSGA